MTEHTSNTCETSNTCCWSCGACDDDFVAVRGRLEESQEGVAWNGVNGDPDNSTLTFAQRLARAGNFSEDIDNAPENDTEKTQQDNLGLHHQLTSHPMQCLCTECCPPTNDSFYAGTIGNRKVISPDTRPYNVTLKNIDPRIVSAVIGKKGAVHKQLVREFYLKSLHIGEPEDQILDSGRKISHCKIVLIGHNRDNLMAATRKIVSILKHEEELYIEIDYTDYRIHQKAFI